MPLARVIFSPTFSIVAATVPAMAQDVITEKALSLYLAHAIASAAVEKCRADGCWPETRIALCGLRGSKQRSTPR
jgi:hypothetical protein